MIRNFLAAGICISVLSIAQAASAGTIVKLGLGGDAAFDIEYSGGELSTVDDGDAATTGDQNTEVVFSDFLTGETDIPTSIASFSLSGLTSSGDAEMFAGVLIAQNFTGGTLSLYDDANTLLLEGSLTSSVLAGTTGTAATGSLLSVDFGDVTGGTLAPQILPNTLGISIGLNSVNGGAGFTAGGPNLNVLGDFEADANLSIAANQIPEPTSALMAVVLAILATGAARAWRR